MKIISSGDSYADALSTAAFATIPFFTIGYLDHPILLDVSTALGILFGCLFLIRFVVLMKKDCPIKSVRLDNIVSALQFPYATALASYILIDAGYETQVGLWMSLGIAVAAVIFILLDNEEY